MWLKSVKISEWVNWLFSTKDTQIQPDFFDLEASLEKDDLEENTNRYLWRAEDLTSSRLELSQQPNTEIQSIRFTNSINLEIHSCEIVISNSKFFSSLVPGEMCNITGGFDFTHGFHSNIQISPNPKEIIEDLSGNTENSIKIVLPILSYVCAKYYLYTIEQIFTKLTEKKNNKGISITTRGVKLFEDLEHLFRDINNISRNDIIDQKIVVLERELTNIQISLHSQSNSEQLIMKCWLSIIIFFIVIQHDDIKANKIQETILRLNILDNLKELQKIMVLDPRNNIISCRLEDWIGSFNRVVKTGENLTFSISKSENETIAKCFYPDMFSLHQEWTYV